MILIILKYCSHCKKKLPLGKYNKHKNEKDGLQPICAECQKEYATKYRQSPRGQNIRRANHTKSRFGLSQKQYFKLLEAQKEVCKICNNPETAMGSGGKKSRLLSVDHNHKTGKIRGLLCHSCNSLIGHARENILILQKTIKYLEENQ